jgi:hypothetical protein
MNDRPRDYDPRDPRTPLDAPHIARPSDPLAYDPLDPVPPAPRSSARAGLVLLAMVAALFVIGFIAFSGPGVDENPTAGIPANNPDQELIVPGDNEPVAPNPGMMQPQAPAAAPAPTETAPAATE